MPPPPEWLKSRIEAIDDGSMLTAYQITKKQERGKQVKACRELIEKAIALEAEEQNLSPLDVRYALDLTSHFPFPSLYCQLKLPFCQQMV
jgi:polyribonucleotide nucleotidyltransferase